MSGLPIVKFVNGSPSCSLRNVRCIVGKSASVQLLTECILPKDNKLHWIVNSYFRNSSQNDNISDCRLRHSADTSKLEIVIAVSALPLELVVKILSYLDCTSLIRMISTNRFYRTELLLSTNKSQCVLWLSMLKNYSYVVDCRANVGSALVIGGSWIGENVPVPAFYFNDVGYYYLYDLNSGEGEKLDYHLLFKQCFIAEWNTHCVRCNSHGDRPSSDHCTIIPILYGYPSPKLIQYHLNSLIALGGDYLLEGASNWRCRACKTEFYSYPYHCGWMDLS